MPQNNLSCRYTYDGGSCGPLTSAAEFCTATSMIKVNNYYKLSFYCYCSYYVSKTIHTIL